MQNTVSRQLSRDKTLDYLFQVSVEEQFEYFSGIQEQPQRGTLMGRFSQWIRGSRN